MNEQALNKIRRILNDFISQKPLDKEKANEILLGNLRFPLLGGQPYYLLKIKQKDFNFIKPFFDFHVDTIYTFIGSGHFFRHEGFQYPLRLYAGEYVILDFANSLYFETWYFHIKQLMFFIDSPTYKNVTWKDFCAELSLQERSCITNGLFKRMEKENAEIQRCMEELEKRTERDGENEILTLLDFNSDPMTWTYRTAAEIVDLLRLYPRFTAKKLGRALKSLSRKDDRIKTTNTHGKIRYLTPPLKEIAKYTAEQILNKKLAK